MPYRENPKMVGSGMLACIPQENECPFTCAGCFFLSGRSYLEPLGKNLPNMPPEWMARNRVVRVNDGNDSAVERGLVLERTAQYQMRFYNTSVCTGLRGYGRPVVLTVNPDVRTDFSPSLLEDIPPNLMFVRFRTNTWNLELAGKVVEHYTSRAMPVVLTFMAYHDRVMPTGHEAFYVRRKRTSNLYWAITHDAWRRVMGNHFYVSNPLVHSCGTEGIEDGTMCRNCGNCLREFFATTERLRTMAKGSW